MKKIISLFMTLTLTAALFVGCNSSGKTVSEEGAPEAIDINIGGLKVLPL